MNPKKQAKISTKLYNRLVKARPSVEQAAEIVSALALAVIMSAPPEQRGYVAVQFLGRIAQHAGLQVVVVRCGQARELPAELRGARSDLHGAILGRTSE